MDFAILAMAYCKICGRQNFCKIGDCIWV